MFLSFGLYALSLIKSLSFTNKNECYLAEKYILILRKQIFNEESLNVPNVSSKHPNECHHSSPNVGQQEIFGYNQVKTHELSIYHCLRLLSFFQTFLFKNY